MALDGKSGDRAWFAVVEDGEVGFLEIANGLALLVPDHHGNENAIDLDFNGGGMSRRHACRLRAGLGSKAGCKQGNSGEIREHWAQGNRHRFGEHSYSRG